MQQAPDPTVIADILVRLLDAGVLTDSRSVRSAACRAVGIKLDDLTAAKRRRPTPIRPHVPPANQNERRWRDKNPSPTTRVCVHCGNEKPRTDFSVKDGSTGALRSFCRSCERIYQRGRYLSTKLVDACATAGVTIDVSQRTPILRCFVCGEPLIGVSVLEPYLRHPGCDPAKPRQRAAASVLAKVPLGMVRCPVCKQVVALRRQDSRYISRHTVLERRCAGSDRLATK
jgi:hypothetical protein